MSYNAVAVAVSSAAGPTIAGVILSSLSWHWLFAINIPLGIIAFYLGYKLLPASQNAIERKFDYRSAIGNALTFGLFIYALEGFAHHESKTLITVSFPIVHGLLLVVSASAISHFDTIASRRLAKNSHIHAVRCHLRLLFHGANAGIGVHSIFPARHIAFFARRNRTAHHTVADSHNDCRAACRKACGTFPPRNAWRYRHVSVFNRIDFVILLPESADKIDIWWRIMFCGAGFGLFQTPNNLTLVSSAPLNRSGGASGMLGMARLIGQTIGTTGVAIVFCLHPAHGRFSPMFDHRSMYRLPRRTVEHLTNQHCICQSA